MTNRRWVRCKLVTAFAIGTALLVAPAYAREPANPFRIGAPKRAPPGPMMDKIVIAIHGIGSQRRSDTIRAVAQRFASRSCPPVPVMPLGFFQIGKVGEVHVSRLDTSEDDPLSRIGFAEVFWADIPRKVAKAEDTLEESKAWGA